MLNILKKYMQLKENFLKNKQKYKSILFVLSKMRQKKPQSENNNYNIEQNETNYDKIEELLDCENIDNIKINLEELNNEEKKELQNFEVSEALLKDIENSLMLKIRKLLEDEKKGNITINENDDKDNNDNKNNNEIKFSNNLGIEKGANISIYGNHSTNDDEDKKE